MSMTVHGGQGSFFLKDSGLTADMRSSAGRAVNTKPRTLVFEFFATSVNAVLGADTTGLEAVVELDGRPLTSDEAGADISWDASGNSVLKIDETRLYQIVELPAFGKRELKLKTNSEGLAIYTVTFGVSEFGP
jgi:hypothetical protein